MIFLWLFLTRTRMGLAMRACAQDAETASSFGVNVSAIIAMNFLIGSAMAGAAGVLIGVYDNQVWPTMGSIPAYKALAIVVLGGLGNIPGNGSGVDRRRTGRNFLYRRPGHFFPERCGGFFSHDSGFDVQALWAAGKSITKFSPQRPRGHREEI